MRAARPWLLPLIVIAALGLAMAGVLTGERSVHMRDVIGFRVPYHALFGDEIRLGHWPSWAPELGGGMPLWHHPSAELANPTAVVFALLPPFHAYGVQVFLNMVLAALGVVLLCRSLRVHPVIGAWTALLYVCSGPVASLWTVKFIPSVSLPFVVYGARRCARPDDRSGLPILACSVGFMLLHPDFPSVVGALILAAAVGLACAPRMQRRQVIVRGMLGGAIGALLAAPFLVPALAHLTHTARAADLGLRAPDLNTLMLLDSLAPGIAGTAWAAGPGAGLGAFTKGDTNNLVANYFLGGVTLLLLASGAWAQRRRTALHQALAGTALGLLVVALGDSIPGVALLWRATASRFPDKLLVPAALAALLLAARFGTLLLRRRPDAARNLAWGAAVFAVLVLPSASLLAELLVQPHAAALGHLAQQAAGHAQRAITWSASLLFVASVAWAAALMDRRRQYAALLVLLAVVGAEAWRSLSTLVHTAPTHRFMQAPAITELPGVGRERLFVGPLSDSGILGGVAGGGLDDDESALLKLARGDPNAGVVFGASYLATVDYSQLEPRRVKEFARDALPRLPLPLAVRVLHKLGAERAIIEGTFPAPPEDTATVRAVYELGGGGRWMDLVFTQPLPAISVETRWQRAETLKDTTLAMARLDDGSHPRVVVEATAPAPADSPDPSASITVEEQRRSAIRARVVSTSGALMVVRWAFDESWAARVDGTAAPVHVANAQQMAVHVPAGEHVVELEYRTRGVGWGLALSAIGAAALAFLTRRKRASA